MKAHYDIVIVGGGMVGASLAVALAPLPFSIAVIEAWPLSSTSQPSYDDRATAVAEGSRRIFDAMGCWQGLTGVATPIRRIHVSDRGRFGFARLDSEEYGVDALGYVLENRSIGGVLWSSLSEQDRVDVHSPARVVAVDPEGDAASIRAETDDGASMQITASLVVAADGARSRVREMLALPASVWDYGQTAVIANVSPTRPHDNQAFERFTDSGPLALLPMSGGRCSLVWTLSPERAAEVSELPDGSFLEGLQDAFGYRLGRFSKAGRRASYPLSLTRAEKQSSGRVLLVGNAAHGIHPVGGQGFNLGLRDVAALAEVLATACGDQREPGDPSVIDSYLAWREPDHRRVMAFTDSLARLFTNPLAPVKAARALGLLGLDLLPTAKDDLARRTMGMHGRLPRLARGLPLA